MKAFSTLLEQQPLLPYIRESHYAVRKPWFQGERRLLDYLLIYVQEGQFRVVVDGENHVLQSGQFCLIQPNSLHTLEGLTSTITPFAHMDLFYHPQRELSFPTRAGQIDLHMYSHLIQPRLNDIQGIHVPVVFTPSHRVHFRDQLLSMISAWQSREPLAQIVAQSLATELIVMLLSDHMHSKTQATPSPQSLNWITAYFSFRLSERISVEDMAKRANLSASRFCTVFKQHFQMSPHQYLLQLRIKHAQELLVTTKITVQDISQYCGFADIHHFSKSFKKHVGQTPSLFRKNNLEA